MCWSRSTSSLIGDLRYPLICQLGENSTFRLQFEQVYLKGLVWLRDSNGHMTLLWLIYHYRHTTCNHSKSKQSRQANTQSIQSKEFIQDPNQEKQHKSRKSIYKP